jgi:FtsH-binding integral membrane protein
MSNFYLPIDETLKATQNKSFYWKMKCFPFGPPSTLSATQTLNHVGLGRQQKKHQITQTTIHTLFSWSVATFTCMLTRSNTFLSIIQNFSFFRALQFLDYPKFVVEFWSFVMLLSLAHKTRKEFFLLWHFPPQHEISWGSSITHVQNSWTQFTFF